MGTQNGHPLGVAVTLLIGCYPAVSLDTKYTRWVSSRTFALSTFCAIDVLCYRCAQPVAIPNVEDVEILLQEADLLQYRHRFEALGYTSFVKFLDMSLEDYQTLGQLANMPHLDVLRLYVACTKIRTEVEGTTGDGANVPLLPVLDEGTNAVPRQAVQVARDPACVPCLQTAQEVKLWSLRNSTQQNCSAMVDVKKSGSKCKVYRCRSLLSKKIESDPDNVHILCPYTLHWNYAAKRGTWKLNAKKSVLHALLPVWANCARFNFQRPQTHLVQGKGFSPV